GRTNDDEMFGVDDLAGEKVVIETTTGVKDSASPTTDVTDDEVTMAQALAALKSTKPKVAVQEQEMSITIPAVATIVTTMFQLQEPKGRTNDDEMFGVDDLAGEKVVIETTTGVKDSASPTTDVTDDEVTMAQALAALKSTKPKVVVQEQEMSITIPAVATIVTTMLQLQEPKRIDEEYARKLEAEEQEATRLSRAQQDEEANNSGDNMQAMMDADRLLAENLQAIEREEFSEVQKARLLVELIEKRKKHFAALRAQMKSQMSTYVKHMGGYKQSHSKGMSFDKIKKLFDREMTKVNDFIAMNSEAQESSTKRTTEHLESDIFKKQKVDENVEPVIDDSEELKKCMEIVPDDGDEVLIEATPISSRSSTIIDYKIQNEGKKNYFKIIRADDRFTKEKPMDDMDNLLFITLKTMFEHHVEDTIWKYQQGLAKVKNWKLLNLVEYIV
nr:hypothetical protein [Tanacetum cinerariifolium]